MCFRNLLSSLCFGTALTFFVFAAATDAYAWCSLTGPHCRGTCAEFQSGMCNNAHMDTNCRGECKAACSCVTTAITIAGVPGYRCNCSEAE